MTSSVHRLHLLFFLFLLLFCGSARAQNDKGNIIHLNSGPVHTDANAARWMDSVGKVTSKQPLQVLIQFYNIPSEQERMSLKMNGVVLEDYVQDNAFVCIIKLPLNTSLINTANLHSIVPVSGEWKGASYLWKRLAELKTSQTEIVVSFYEDVDITACKKIIDLNGGQILPGKLNDYGAYTITINANKIKGLAEWYGVKYISPVSQDVLLDYRSKGMEGANIAGLPAAVGGYGLLGDSITIGVGDNVSGIYHADLYDRIINYNPAPDTHHGVHINGIVGGAGIIDPAA
ncbi:MAG: hypothetical protein JSS96_16175, partial [Bacteroidetes bacterium]|nr:hypothetical protein [Bacteroidota bacterium]